MKENGYEKKHTHTHTQEERKRSNDNINNQNWVQLLSTQCDEKLPFIYLIMRRGRTTDHQKSLEVLFTRYPTTSFLMMHSITYIN